jgi:hypothetical protein
VSDPFGLTIESTDATGNLRPAPPDFAAVTADGVRHLIGTKGLEDVNVAHGPGDVAVGRGRHDADRQAVG